MAYANYLEWQRNNPLNRYMLRKTIKYKDMAMQADVSLNTLYKWLNGLSRPSPENLDKLCELTQRSLDKEWDAWLKEKGELNG